MSSLWTPSGEHRVPRPDHHKTPQPGGRGDAEPHAAGRPGATAMGPEGEAAGASQPNEAAEAAARVAELEEQLAKTPAEVVVANHCYGLFQLAALHLSRRPPNLEAARLAIDALGALVEGLPGRLGSEEASLREGLAQIRLAFVTLKSAPPGDGSGLRPER